MAATLVPSFVAKMSRAKKHIIDLEAEIGRYVGLHPYAVADRIEGQGKIKRKVRLLTFTDPANTDIPILAADAIYNLRSCLDHLQNSIVPNNRRGSVFFPIYFQGVWDPEIPGENEQRLKQRGRWITDVKGLPDDAIAILKSLQPLDGTLPKDEVNLLSMINTLSNADRHTKLPIVVSGLDRAQVSWELPDGTIVTGIGEPDEGFFIENNAELGKIPEDAVNVKIEGTPLIVARIGDQGGHVKIPQDLVLAARLIELRIIPTLTGFVQH